MKKTSTAYFTKAIKEEMKAISELQKLTANDEPKDELTTKETLMFHYGVIQGLKKGLEFYSQLKKEQDK